MRWPNPRLDEPTAPRAHVNLVSKAGERNLVERWEDEDLNRMNLQIWNAYTSYGAVLMFPNGTDLTAAEESHDQARRAYESLR